MKTNCLNCGQLTPKHGMKTCCRKCADAQKIKNNSWTRECIHCNTLFTTRNSNKNKLCSEECRKQWAIIPENIEKRIFEMKNSVKKKYGVENVFQIESIKNNIKKDKLLKYGDVYYNNPNKMINTKYKLYGDNHFIEAMKK